MRPWGARAWRGIEMSNVLAKRNVLETLCNQTLCFRKRCAITKYSKVQTDAAIHQRSTRCEVQHFRNQLMWYKVLYCTSVLIWNIEKRKLRIWQCNGSRWKIKVTWDAFLWNAVHSRKSIKAQVISSLQCIVSMWKWKIECQLLKFNWKKFVLMKDQWGFIRIRHDQIQYNQTWHKIFIFSVPHHALGFPVDLIGKVKKGATVRSKHRPGEERYND